MEGKSRRPSVKCVSMRGSPPAAARAQRFSLPDRSLMKYNVPPSRDHIGHPLLAPPVVTGS
jgi:hypothetical protein